MPVSKTFEVAAQSDAFRAIDRSNYPQQIAARIRGLILERRLASGDRLPTEREMAQLFGVSRSSIREAIKLLSAVGLLDSRTGAGIHVSANLGQSVLQPLSLAIFLSEGVQRDLVEARQVLEPGLAALAAQHASEAQKEEMLRTVNQMEAALGHPEEVALADLEFHLIVAKATGNQLLLEVLVGFQHLLRPHITGNLITLPGQQEALRGHKLIYSAIKRSDPEGAREAMAASFVKETTHLASPPVAS